MNVWVVYQIKEYYYEPELKFFRAFLTEDGADEYIKRGIEYGIADLKVKCVEIGGE